MGKQRKLRIDGWKKEEDQMLGKIMVESFSKGLKQSAAIRIAEQFTGRTFQACMTRWKTHVKKDYEHLISEAPVHTGQENKIDLTSKNYQEKSGGVIDSMHTILEYVQSTENLFKQLEELTNQNEQLQKQLDTANNKVDELQQDYEAVLKVIELARKSVVRQDEMLESSRKTQFKMDRNGNLERV